MIRARRAAGFALLAWVLLSASLSAQEIPKTKKIKLSSGREVTWTTPAVALSFLTAPYYVLSFNSGFQFSLTYAWGDEDFGNASIQKYEETRFLIASAIWQFIGVGNPSGRGFKPVVGVGGHVSHIDWTQMLGPRGTGPYQSSEWNGVSFGPVLFLALDYRFRKGQVIAVELPTYLFLGTDGEAPDATAILQITLSVPL